jgi:peptidoglycan/LPS O-acetylase OafA/YrhL
MVVFCIIVSLTYHYTEISDISPLLSQTIIPHLMRDAIFYEMGIVFAEKDFLDQNNWGVESVIAVICWAILFNVNYFVDLKLFGGVCWIMIAFCGSLAVIGISKKLKSTFVTKLGRDSLGLYLLDGYFSYPVIIVLKHVWDNTTMTILISFVIAVVGSYFGYRFCINNRYLCCLFQPQKLLKQSKR